MRQRQVQGTPALVLGCVVALGGCYDGLSGDGAADAAGETEGTNPGTGDSGSDDSDTGPGDDPVPQDQCAEVGESPDLIIRRLNVFEYSNTVEDVLGVDIREDAQANLPQDIRVDGFSNTVGAQIVSFDHIEAYHELSNQIVQRVPNLSALSTETAGCAEFTDACEDALVRGLGLKLWRRPLSDAEAQSFSRLFDAVQGENEGFDVAVGLTLRTMLEAPQFLYRLEDETPDENGGPTRALDSYEMASRLSYLVWGSAPDDALYEAAAGDMLLQTEEIERQIDRMLQTPRAREVSLQYVSDWLALNSLTDLNRDAELYPEFSPELAADMREETRRLFEHVVWEEGGSVLSVLDAQYTFASPELAAFYGIENPESDWAMYDLTDMPNRGGIMSHAGVLALSGHGDRPSMVERGLFVLRSILCSDVVAAPANIDISMDDLDPNASERVKSEARMDNATCVTCHGQIDPLAWAFERYDGIGNYREVDEFGNPLLQDGFYVSPTSDGKIDYANLDELVSIISADEAAQLCIGVKRPLQFAVGRPLAEADRCAIEDVAMAAAENGGTYQSLIKAIAIHPSFRRIRLN